MYSILTVQPDGARKEKRKIKGVPKKAVTNVRHLEYREVLEEGSERRATFAQLRSRAHEIAVETVEKKSLSPFNDKVYGSAPFDLVEFLRILAGKVSSPSLPSSPITSMALARAAAESALRSLSGSLDLPATSKRAASFRFAWRARVLQLEDLHHHGVGVREEQPIFGKSLLMWR